jgi:hypothetical protein
MKASGPDYSAPEDGGPGTLWVGSWVGHRAGLETVPNLVLGNTPIPYERDATVQSLGEECLTD